MRRLSGLGVSSSATAAVSPDLISFISPSSSSVESITLYRALMAGLHASTCHRVVEIRPLQRQFDRGEKLSSGCCSRWFPVLRNAATAQNAAPFLYFRGRHPLRRADLKGVFLGQVSSALTPRRQSGNLWLSSCWDTQSRRLRRCQRMHRPDQVIRTFASRRSRMVRCHSDLECVVASALRCPPPRQRSAPLCYQGR